MTIAIEITGCICGETVLYEFMNQQGRQHCVPAYSATMELWGSHISDSMRFHFSVTRDVSEVVFGTLSDRYGTHGECPPSRQGRPYYGTEHAYRGTGFAIRLHDDDDPARCFLQGEGTVKRQNILIHRGPGRSLGCMMVVGGEAGFAAFEAAYLNLRQYSQSGQILVFVEPRLPVQHNLIRSGG